MTTTCASDVAKANTPLRVGRKDEDPVKTALVNLRKKLQGEEVGDEPQGEDSKEHRVGIRQHETGNICSYDPFHFGDW